MSIYAAVLTPMHEDYSCNIEELVRHSKDLLEKGCNGIVLFGTTGEGNSFSVSEKINVLQKVIAKGIDPQKIILANGSGNIPDTKKLITAGIEANIAFHLIAPPCYYKNVSDEGVIQYYRSLITPDARILLYHIPELTGVAITLPIIKELLLDFPKQIVGIKESEGNLEYAKAILQAYPDFRVYVGKELEIIEAMRYGAAGAICGMPNLFPELIVRLLHATENPPELIHIKEAAKGKPFIAYFKSLMEKKHGSAWHTLRPPLTPI